MSTNVTWFDGVTYSVPGAGEVNWPALANLLIALGQKASITVQMKQAVRKATTSPVTVSDTTDCVVVTQPAVPGAVTVNLPAGSSGRLFFIVDGTGDAQTNNITINRNGSDTIAGATTLVLNKNKQGVVLAYSVTDTDWKVLLKTETGLLNPMTTTGDMIYSSDNSGSTARLAIGAAGTVLQGGATPSWAKVADANVSATAAIAGSKLQAASGSNTGTVSYENSGTFTIDMSVGFMAPGPNVITMRYVRVGNMVTLLFPFFDQTAAATSNIFSSAAAAMPAYLTPAVTNTGTILTFNNNLVDAQPGFIRVQNDGVLSVQRLAGSWVATTTHCGIENSTYTYLLN